MRQTFLLLALLTGCATAPDLPVGGITSAELRRYEARAIQLVNSGQGSTTIPAVGQVDSSRPVRFSFARNGPGELLAVVPVKGAGWDFVTLRFDLASGRHTVTGFGSIH